VSDWLAPPPADQRMPTIGDVANAWEVAGVEVDSIVAPGVATLLTELCATHANGGALFARFRIGASPTLHRIAVVNRWQEYGVLDSFLRSAAVRKALPELRVGDRLLANPVWEEGGALTLGGVLAHELVAGGAYRQFERSAAEAKTIGDGFCAALFGDRFGDVQVYATSSRWAPWFFDVAWDRTWVLIDRRERAIAILCLTDTD
jgi:hypothetical protein